MVYGPYIKALCHLAFADIQGVPMVRYKFSVFSHGFTVSLFYVNDKQAILEFSKDLATFEEMWVPKLRRKIRKVKSVFAAASMDRMEYSFLIADFVPLIKFLKERGYTDADMSIYKHNASEGMPIEIELGDGVAPKDQEQRDVVEFINSPDKTNIVLNLRTGGGKAQPLASKIKIPGGWSTMGEMEVGKIITAPDGTPTKVTGVHPQGLKGCYKLTFSDGRSCEADGEHLWRVYVKGEELTIDTAEVHGLVGTGNVLTIPLPTSEHISEVELPMDPYELGIGLGAMDNNHKLPTGIVDLEGYTQLNGLAYGEYIPKLYLHASTTQRLNLVRGLMDACGHTVTDGSVYFTSNTYTLAKNLQYLVRSLGGCASLTTNTTNRFVRGAINRTSSSYRVYVEYPIVTELYSCNRKKTNCMSRGKYLNKVECRIVNVEYIGRKETQCISVDHPDKLYITDDFIVTHNTFLGLNSIANFKVRTALIMNAGHFKTWQDSMSWVYKDEKNYCIVRGRDNLKRLIELSIAGENEYKLIYISIATLRKYITDYLATGETIEGVHPRELFSVLGVGYRIVDEAHQSIHAIAIQNIFTHVNKTLYLSATLVTEDPFLQKQYKKMFPLEDQFKKGVTNKHARGISITYRVKDRDKIRCTGGKGYSHVVYEHWIMSNKQRLSNYIEMIESILTESFISVREGKQKALIFCSTTELCKIVADQLRISYGDRFTISDYVASHDPSVLHDNDIVVSTPLSAGTGVDIEDLRVAISTVAVRSIQLNQQMAGRLRPLRNHPNVTPDYIWLNCGDIPQHLQYNSAKMEQLGNHTKEIKYTFYNTEI
jgi:hypothetical protein